MISSQDIINTLKEMVLLEVKMHDLYEEMASRMQDNQYRVNVVMLARAETNHKKMIEEIIEKIQASTKK